MDGLHVFFFFFHSTFSTLRLSNMTMVDLAVTIWLTGPFNLKSFNQSIVPVLPRFCSPVEVFPEMRQFSLVLLK